MSFILDALKKSENERQQQVPSEFATVPSSPDSPGVPRWLWILGALLAINLVVLLGLLMRPDTPATRTTPGAIVGNTSAPVIVEADDFAERVAVAREAPPARPAIEAADPGPAPTPDTITAEPVIETANTIAPMPEPAAIDTSRPANDNYLPTLTDLRLDGRMALPDMHIDIHVFAEARADRFVFINMNKYREREQLSEGPTVREIRRDGVVLEYRGIAFLLPRE